MSPLDTAYAGITSVVAARDDHDLLLPSGCHGWTVCDLLLHLTLDAQRALVTFATPADDPPDVDAVSYWRAPPDDPADVVAHTQWVRRSAAAFDRPAGVVRVWTDTAPAAVRAAAAADPATRVATQGHVLTVPDFIATLVTEAVIHHLDLAVRLPDAPGPAPSAVAVARSTLDGLAGPDGLPSRWTPHEALLKSTGRAGLSELDRRELGSRAGLLPLLS
jgi:hypothetical protein